MAALRRQDSGLICGAAFWASDDKAAARIADAVDRATCDTALTETEATARLRAIAAGMKIRLTDHVAVMQRVRTAMSHVKDKLEEAQQAGGLKWFNRAFHEYRLRARACGLPALNYGQAQARLRKALVKRALSGNLRIVANELMPEIFPSQTGAPN